MDKVMLITGASRGIGAAIAELASQKGYAVAINYRNNHKQAEELCSKIKSQGGKAITVQGDVSIESDVLRIFSETLTAFGSLHSLVNNAGIIAPLARLEDFDRARLARIFAVNVIGSFLCAKQAVKHMSLLHGGKGGSIINISSIASRLGSPNEFIDYAATKGAIDTMTIGLAKEVATEGIRVNAVRPGLIETDMHADTGDAERAEKLKKSIPLKRIGLPEEIARSVIWLDSEAASYVTGSILDVSGGR
ncbi:MAG: glucose 1-dehydrogenase [Spirochaetota bacterium]